MDPEQLFKDIIFYVLVLNEFTLFQLYTEIKEPRNNTENWTVYEFMNLHKLLGL